MGFKKFDIKIIGQIILIGIWCFLLNWSFFQEHLIIARFTFAALLVIQIIFLINFIRNTNKKLSQFIEWIKSEGYSERFSAISTSSSQQELNNNLNEIISSIAESKAETESKHHYFNQTLDIIGTGIISIHNNSSILIFNKAAQELLKCRSYSRTSELEQQLPKFSIFLKTLKNGEQKSLKFSTGGSLLHIIAKCIVFNQKDEVIKLISFQDISNELAIEELNAWQKLIQVLRHEIMNSVTPIKSLTSILIRIFSSEGKAKNIKEINQEAINNTLNSLLAIDKRNQGMLNFIESYRSITNIPKPVFKEIYIKDLVEQLKLLFSSEIEEKNIDFKIHSETNKLMLLGDEKLLTQVFINLIKNAIESFAYHSEKKIQLTLSQSSSKGVLIKITDNGCGIDPDDIDNIFVPFYTNKESGSGIGLSLCRQIMHLHKGKIEVVSKKGEGSTFTLHF